LYRQFNDANDQHKQAADLHDYDTDARFTPAKMQDRSNTAD